jgi:hypothetical protein
MQRSRRTFHCQQAPPRLRIRTSNRPGRIGLLQSDWAKLPQVIDPVAMLDQPGQLLREAADLPLAPTPSYDRALRAPPLLGSSSRIVRGMMRSSMSVVAAVRTADAKLAGKAELRSYQAISIHASLS